MNSFERKVYVYIKENKMIGAGDVVCVGLSGGADSVCLLTVLSSLSERLGIEKLIAVHVNHGIRGEEASRDEEFVKEFCEKLKVSLYVKHMDIPALAQARHETVEETGRHERYAAFEEVLYDVRKEVGIEEIHEGKIAVAHNRMDNAETVLFHLVRGTGIRGVCGIPPVRGHIIRPLLDAGRDEIEAYLNEREISYVTDSTNFLTDYDRNKIRHEVLPILKSINSAAVEHITDFVKDAKVVEERLEQDTLKNLDEVLIGQSDMIALSVSRLLLMDDFMQRRVLYAAFEKASGKRKDVTARHIINMQKLLKGDTGARTDLPYGFICRKNYDTLIIEGRKAVGDDMAPIELDKEGKVRLSAGWVEMKIVDINNLDIDYKKTCIKAFDCDKIKDTLCVRMPADGDYIVINADGRRKSISKLFIDLKLDRESRKQVPVVCMGNEVLWVVGIRGTENYHITEETKRVLVLSYTELN